MARTFKYQDPNILFYELVKIPLRKPKNKRYEKLIKALNDKGYYTELEYHLKLKSVEMREGYK